MYLHLAWPTLFSWLRRFFDTTILTYPRYHADSRLFMNLCGHLSSQVEDRPPNAMLALMRMASPMSMSDEEVRLEAFSYIRGGQFHSYSLPQRARHIF